MRGVGVRIARQPLEKAARAGTPRSRDWRSCSGRTSTSRPRRARTARRTGASTARARSDCARLALLAHLLARASCAARPRQSANVTYSPSCLEVILGALACVHVERARAVRPRPRCRTAGAATTRPARFTISRAAATSSGTSSALVVGPHQQAPTSRGRERHRADQLGVVGEPRAQRCLRPAEVEDELSVRVVLEVQRQRRHQLARAAQRARAAAASRWRAGRRCRLSSSRRRKPCSMNGSSGSQSASQLGGVDLGEGRNNLDLRAPPPEL